MTQATEIYFRRLRTLLNECNDPRYACLLITDVALSTSFNKSQRKELVELFKEKSGHRFYICRHCAEPFKSQIDLETHQFNNKYCSP